MKILPKRKLLISALILIIFIIFCSSTGFAQFLSPGKLTKSHSSLVGVANCVKCHTLGKGIPDSACMSCHDKLVERIKKGQGLHASVDGQCINCHTEHKGEDYNIMPVDQDSFDHSKTGYELKDNHKQSCDKCHKGEKTFLGLSRDCFNCHTDVHKKALSGDCLKCHNYTEWKKVKFEHSQSEEFALTGKHTEVKCESCHPEQVVESEDKAIKILKFKPVKSGKCNDCHFDIHKGELKEKKCKSCHSTEEWQKTAFDHKNKDLSDFKLEGKHEEVSCDLCHPKEMRTAGLISTPLEKQVKKLKAIKHEKCYDCHFDVHQGQFKDRNCNACHSVETAWKEYTFKHEPPEYKGFKLEGKHSEAACEKCHKRTEQKYAEFDKEKKVLAGTFTAIKSEKCNDCHFDVHQGLFKDRSCNTCHSVKTAWKDYTFKHESPEYKGFKLEGKHSEAACEKCHKRTEQKYAEFDKEKKVLAGTFTAIKSEKCNDCHFDVHQGQFKDRNCNACHSVETAWKEYTFKHESPEYKGFKLEGKHSEAACEKCHKRTEQKYAEFDKEKKVLAGTFTSIKSEKCNDCHFDVHQGQFKDRNCNACHSVETAWKEYTFKHESPEYKGFKLEGKHSEAECEKCHIRSEILFSEFNVQRESLIGKFSSLGTGKCNDCHDDIHKGKYEEECSKCHTPHSWKPKEFLHDATSFELKGSHSTLKCAQCHMETQTYTGLDSDCISCHKDSHSNRFAQTCTDCHKQSTWLPVDFKHNVGFKLAGLHRVTDCRACHLNNDFSSTPTDCYSCHQDDYQIAPDHAVSGYSSDCTECHSTAAAWEQASYNHSSFSFSGAHNALKNNCSICHSSSNSLHAGTTDIDCYNCHSVSGVANSSYEQTNSPSHTVLGFSTNCTDCHSTTVWSGAKFSHTGFNLTGVHTTLDCNACHSTGYPGNYAGTSEDDCYACHSAQHASQHPDIPQNCTQCHSSSTWAGASSHANFNLSGVHTSLDCSACHSTGYPGNYAGTSEDDCYTCHSAQHASEHPDFPQDCTQCHSSSTWAGASSHANFNLSGVHTSLDCSACHSTGYPGNYAGTSEDDCYACHSAQHASEHPDFPQDCTQCHSSSTWAGASSHANFNLSGIHTTLDCSACHSTGYPGNYAGTSEDDCYACHSAQHASEHPDFPQDCTQCHSSSTWAGASSHANFNLTGIHTTLDCSACHSTGYPGNYAGTSEDDCYACHSAQHASEHPDFPQDCTQCHSSSTWAGASSHANFNLSGIHTTLDCSACHSTGYPGNYAGTSEDDCYACHSAQHASEHPDFPQDCTQCHSSSTWAGASSHANFNLTGIHTTLDCSACHSTGYPGNYAGTSEDDCYACHSAQHASEHPDFPQDCTQCHSSSTWAGASSHANFNLTGIHTTLDCSACHSTGYPGNYAGTSEDDCYACHSAQHASEHPDFPQDCTQCHSSSTWAGASSHANFNLSGIHTTLDCSACHSTGYPGNYAGTSEDDCYACHSAQHASEHPDFPQDCTQCHSSSTWAGASSHANFNLTGIHTTLDCSACHSTGYPGNYAGTSEDDCYACHSAQHASEHPDFPQDCTQCHNSNTWTGATAHTIFNLTGIHATLNCTACHSTGYPGNYAGTADDDCYACHSALHASEHPEFPQDCTQCHNSNSWAGASFSHESFALIGTHTSFDCDKCHQTGYPGQYAGASEDDCYTCHERKYNDKHRTCPQDCTLCHNIFNWGNPNENLRDSLGCR